MANTFDQQQQQQQMSLMAMAAAGMSSGTQPSLGGMGTVPPMPQGGMTALPGDGASSAATAAMAAAAAGGSAFPPPGVDPVMAQAYAQMFTTYLQQAQAYAAVDPTNLAGGMGMGMPSAPFPAMGMPYAMPMQAAPVIAVSVDGMKFQYQLTEDDLHKVFSRYGAVKHIYVDEVGTTAQITFEHVQQAQAAMNDLNGKVLNGLEGVLRLSWASQGATQPSANSYPAVASNYQNWNFPQQGQNQWGCGGTAPQATPEGMPAMDMAALGAGAAGGAGGAGGIDNSLGNLGAMDSVATGGGGLAGADGKAPAHVKGVRKYTCRFLIGIDNDQEFQVVRRIIGAKGTNMKRIVKQTEAKLRLRGVGSGYFEGAGQKESSEPLQLCVSCTSAEGYGTAVKLVEELMENVYNEYRQFCRENGKPEPDLHASPQLVPGNSANGLSSHGGSPPRPARGGIGGGGALEDSPGYDDRGDAGGGKSEGGRRRGRRSRARKGEAARAAAERGDPPPKAPPIDDIERMIDQRNEARRQCNFIEADRIRQSLHEKGIALMDEPGARGKGAEVTTWRYWRE